MSNIKVIEYDENNTYHKDSIIELSETFNFYKDDIYANIYPEKTIEYIKHKFPNVVFTNSKKNEFLSMLKSSTGKVYGYLLIDNNKIVGFVLLSDYQNFIRYLEMTFIFIHPDYRNKGYGKLMIKIISHFCNKLNYNGITVGCYTDNKEAIKFYLKNGFLLECIKPRMLYDDNLNETYKKAMYLIYNIQK
jgi:RimJ/RimL family protein N-acetyltransferase